MYTLKDNNVIEEVKCGNNFEYILQDNVHFLNLDYKVLQNQTSGMFVQCMRMARNGKTSLYYLTDEYRPMSSMFAGITADNLITVVINLFASIIEVRNNGFLTCQNIDLSWDKIFVEQNTLKVKLVYLPMEIKVFDSYAEFESELRSAIVKLINRVIDTSNERLEKFVLDLCNGSLSLEEVYNKTRSAETPPVSSPSLQQKPYIQNSGTDYLKLVAMNAPFHFEIVLDRDNILLGKKQELVDAVIPFNNMISRKHCRITRINDIFYITDEGSANGTYVNQLRVERGKQYPINRGDVIRMADSDFQIV